MKDKPELPDDGGSAFPVTCQFIDGQKDKAGMSLRDYFAAAALTALAAEPGLLATQAGHKSLSHGRRHDYRTIHS